MGKKVKSFLLLLRLWLGLGAGAGRVLNSHINHYVNSVYVCVCVCRWVGVSKECDLPTTPKHTFLI